MMAHKNINIVNPLIVDSAQLLTNYYIITPYLSQQPVYHVHMVGGRNSRQIQGPVRRDIK